MVPSPKTSGKGQSVGKVVHHVASGKQHVGCPIPYAEQVIVAGDRRAELVIIADLLLCPVGP